VIAASTLAIASGCSHRTTAKVSTPAKISPPAKLGATETGLASWYGAPYHGRRTASGEVYDMEQLTAAHRTLPFQTWVEVTDLDNGKIVNVRITDRGPFVDGRVIDLSLAAARKIEMVGPGTARVKLKVVHMEDVPAPIVKTPPPISPPPQIAPVENRRPEVSAREVYTVQAAAFSDRDQAEAFSTSLRDRFGNLIDEARVVSAPPVWKVLLGREMTADAANALATKLRDAGAQALVVRDR
jgi:rare lipoprotein A